MDIKILSLVVSSISLIFNILIVIVGWYVAHKIMNNDLYHLDLSVKGNNQTIKELKQEVTAEIKNFKKETRDSFSKEIEKQTELASDIYLELSRIKTSIASIDTRCQERMTLYIKGSKDN